MVSILGYKGEATIQWEACDASKFTNEHMLREARFEPIRTFTELFDFVDNTEFLKHMDETRIYALLEINRSLYPIDATPCVYWEQDYEYFMMKFLPAQDNIVFGHLPMTYCIDDDEVMASSSWLYMSIKSMI